MGRFFNVPRTQGIMFYVIIQVKKKKISSIPIITYGVCTYVPGTLKNFSTRWGHVAGLGGCAQLIFGNSSFTKVNHALY